MNDRNKPLAEKDIRMLVELAQRGDARIDDAHLAALWDAMVNKTIPKQYTEAEEQFVNKLTDPTRFNELRPHVMTAFVIPFNYGEDLLPIGRVARTIKPDDPDYRERLLQIGAMPFPCIRIVSKGPVKNDGKQGATVETDCICRWDDDEFDWATRTIFRLVNSRTMTAYHWAGQVRKEYGGGKISTGQQADPFNLPEQYFTLMDALADRQNRYIEQRVSRQIRRAQGFSPNYHEYIVVRKHDAPKGEPVLTRAEIFRRHPHLHAVRGHLRHYRSGLVVPVRPHQRGTGNALQVKDYVLR